jgi:hypothetical protein
MGLRPALRVSEPAMADTEKLGKYGIVEAIGSGGFAT